jgi:hypothetical protein
VVEAVDTIHHSPEALVLAEQAVAVMAAQETKT